MAFLRGVRGLLAGVLLALVLSGAAPHAQATLEHEVRAAFLYNFTRFIDWPTGAMPEDRFRICVLGDERLAAAVEAMVAGERVQSRPIALLTGTPADGLRGCQILYVAGTDLERTSKGSMLTAVRNAPVLTVGESPAFLSRGGAIRFVLEDNRVRFDVSLPALQQAGLTASSKLLRVARTVSGVAAP